MLMFLAVIHVASAMSAVDAPRHASLLAERHSDESFSAPLPVHIFSADSREARGLYKGCHRSITEQELAALEASMGIHGPDWIMVGAQKAGTTSFEASVKDIVCSSLSDSKAMEVHFFNDVRFARRPINAGDMRNYLSVWAQCRDSPAVLPHFEKTPDYATQPWAAQRMCETLGSRVKLTMLMREPVSRAYSSFYESPDPDYPLPLTPDSFHTEALIEMKHVGEAPTLVEAA